MSSLRNKILVTLPLILLLIFPIILFALENVHICIPEASVYEKPGVTDTKLADLDYGTPIKILGYEKIGAMVWYRIEFQQGQIWKKGWIACRNISPRYATLEEYRDMITVISEKSIKHANYVLTAIPIILAIAAAAGYYEFRKVKDNLVERLDKHDAKEEEYHKDLEKVRKEAIYKIDSMESYFWSFMGHANWELKKVREAISHTEKALKKAIEIDMEEIYILRLKNNLAYAYAEAEKRTISERDKAIKYAELLKEKHGDYKIDTWLTTWARVKIMEAEEKGDLNLIEEIIGELEKYESIYPGIREQVPPKLKMARKIKKALKGKTA